MVAAIPVSPRFPEISLLSGLLPCSDLSRRLEARMEIRRSISLGSQNVNVKIMKTVNSSSGSFELGLLTPHGAVLEQRSSSVACSFINLGLGCQH